AQRIRHITSQHHRVQSNIQNLHNTSLPAAYAVNPQSEFSVLPPENIRIACDSYVYLYLLVRVYPENKVNRHR
ncbi:hypothetical protein, partial [Citrobacter portucalensis]|uniref:hypothetical protein n=1 Tax=Citrobacter portucalensis TaxID=1639133 RepID=UPI002B228F56